MITYEAAMHGMNIYEITTKFATFFSVLLTNRNMVFYNDIQGLTRLELHAKL